MEVKAKTLSLTAKIIAVVFAVTCFILSHIYRWNIPVWEILAMASFIAEAFVTVDVSMWITNAGKAFNMQQNHQQKEKQCLQH